MSSSLAPDAEYSDDEDSDRLSTFTDSDSDSTVGASDDEHSDREDEDAGPRGKDFTWTVQEYATYRGHRGTVVAETYRKLGNRVWTVEDQVDAFGFAGIYQCFYYDCFGKRRDNKYPFELWQPESNMLAIESKINRAVIENGYHDPKSGNISPAYDPTKNRFRGIVDGCRQSAGVFCPNLELVQLFIQKIAKRYAWDEMHIGQVGSGTFSLVVASICYLINKRSFSITGHHPIFMEETAQTGPTDIFRPLAVGKTSRLLYLDHCRTMPDVDLTDIKNILEVECLGSQQGEWTPTKWLESQGWEEVENKLTDPYYGMRFSLTVWARAGSKSSEGGAGEKEEK